MGLLDFIFSKKKSESTSDKKSVETKVESHKGTPKVSNNSHPSNTSSTMPSIKSIANGCNFNIKFKNTTIRKVCYNGQESEVLKSVYSGEGTCTTIKCNNGSVTIDFQDANKMRNMGILSESIVLRPYENGHMTYQQHNNGDEFATREFNSYNSFVTYYQVTKQGGNVVAFIIMNPPAQPDCYYLAIMQQPIASSVSSDYLTQQQSTAHDSSSINDIVELAQLFNFAHNSGNSSAGHLSTVFYNKARSGRSLLRLNAEDCQSVGLAFTNIALCYSFGDQDVNSVASENAFYCLSKNLIETGNSFVAPAIFTIMQKGSMLMKDQLIASWCKMAEKQVGLPIGIMLGGNPFTDPNLSDFRKQAIDFKDKIAYYALLKFYDVEKEEYKIPTDMPYFIPTVSEVNSLLERVREDSSYGTEKYLKNCEDHFTSVYNQCKDSLMKF